MNRFIDLIGVFGERKGQELPKFPDFGPIDLPDYEKFLEKSKGLFFEKWVLAKEKGSIIKFKDKGFQLKDFKKLKLIGAGAFGQVYLVNNEQTGQFHAMKTVLKKTVIELKQLENTKTEKLVLQCTNCPFTLRLDFFFKDNSFLYFVVPFIQGGELYYHLQHLGSFDETTAMFYVAQVILALEYLHYLNLIYRDLKPENILLDHTGYIKLTDFGFCKLLKNGRTYTFCGTMDYLAPEIVLNEGYGKAVDWWAVGVLAYELTTGDPPFKDKTEIKVFKRIVRGKYTFPPFVSRDLKDLISHTLHKDLTRRYGNLKGGVDDFKNHRWFKPLNWQAVICRKAVPPYIPKLEGSIDVKYFKDYTYKSLVVSDEMEYGNEFIDF